MAEKKLPTADLSFDDDLQIGDLEVDDGPNADLSASFFDEPMKLTYQETERINDGRLGTATVVGLRDISALRSGKISHDDAQKQLGLFARKLENMEKQRAELKTAPTKFIEYGKWREQIFAIKNSSDTANQLRRMIDGEQEKLSMAELITEAKVYLRDGILEWAEHLKMLALAAQLGLSPEHVERAYEPFNPFERETQEAAKKKAGAKDNVGWPAMKKLSQPSDAGVWNLARLWEALIHHFSIAVEVCDLDTENKYSLYAYLEDKDPKAAEHAKEARDTAKKISPDQPHPLAVWSFLWATSPTAILHVTGKGHLPTHNRRLQVKTLNDIENLIGDEKVLDDLGWALTDGLLEHWLRFAIPNSSEAQQRAKQAAASARNVVDSKRQDFLRRSVPWALGIKAPRPKEKAADVISLLKGANVSLSKQVQNLGQILVCLGWDTRAAKGSDFELDASAFLLGANGKVSSDNDFIFYNNPRSEDGAVEYSSDNSEGNDNGVIRIDLDETSQEVARIAIAVTIHDAEDRGQSFGMVRNAYVRILNKTTGSEIARYDISNEDTPETAMIFAEIYRHKGEWKFKAIGQGYTGGLAPLARQMGVDISS